MKTFFPLVSSFRSRKEWEDACWEKLAKSPEILKSVVAATERHSLIMRAAVLDRLHVKIRFRDIMKELNLSRQTLSTIQKAAQENNYQSYRQRGKTERKKKSCSHENKVPKKMIRMGKQVRTKYGIVCLP